MQPSIPVAAAGFVPALRHLVTVTKLHPILVNFTAALVPVSVVSDFLARILKNESLRNTAWWTLFYATIITPLTAITGWLFWMSDDNGVAGMTVHKWLGSALAALLFVLFFWRRRVRREGAWPSVGYLMLGLLFVVALVYQGHLGGVQVFSDM